MIGLFLRMCADVLLGINFIVGTLCFIFGHFFYIYAFYIIHKFTKKDIFITILVSILSVYAAIGTPFIKINDLFMKIFLVVYALIISIMLGKAISNFITFKSLPTLLILIGSILFWFSDIMLGIDMFGTSSRLVWILCSYSYWPAQNLFAFSLYHFKKEIELL